jgi:hypothetical protein
VWVVVPVALVMVKVLAAALDKVLVRKAEAMVEATKLGMVVAVSS